MRPPSSTVTKDANKRTALNLAVIVGLGACIAHLLFHIVSNDPYPGDFVWALRTAYTLLNGIDPYGFTPDPEFVPYPLPVALFGLPFVWPVRVNPFWVAGAIFVGVSTGLLTWGMLRVREGWRLAATLLSGPFWMALIMSQWSPLIVASWYLPVLSPLLVTIKPQIALPVAIARRPSILGIAIAAAVLALSLVIDPTWPIRYLPLIGQYQSIIPALTLPLGPCLLLAALQWRDERARLLLLMALMPQRTVYDFLALWLVPASTRNQLVLSLLSWGVVAMGIPTWPAILSTPDMRWAIHLLYLPVLAMVLWRGYVEARRAKPAAPNQRPLAEAAVTNEGSNPHGP